MVNLNTLMREHIELCGNDSTKMEQYWVKVDTGEIEFVHDHEEYGSVKDAIDDGYVRGGYSNYDHHHYLEAKDVRTLCLAIRHIIQNHDSAQGIYYDLSSGETGHLDRDQMLAFRLSCCLPQVDA